MSGRTLVGPGSDFVALRVLSTSEHEQNTILRPLARVEAPLQRQAVTEVAMRRLVACIALLASLVLIAAMKGGS